MLAVAGQKAEVWDTKTWRLRYSFPCNGRMTAWSPDSRTVAFEGRHNEGGIVEARDVETGSVRWTLRKNEPKFAFSPDGKTLAVGDGEGNLDFFDAPTGHDRSRIPGHRNFNLVANIVNSAFSPDGSQFTAGKNKEIGLWDLKAGSLIGECHPPDFSDAVAWSAEGKTIATVGAGRTQIWDAALHECEHEFPGWSPALSADGTRLVNSDDKAIRSWDVAAGRKLFEIPSPVAPFWVSRYSLSPDSKTLAVAAEKHVKLYDMATAALTGSLEGAEWPVVWAWSPDGKTVSAACGETIHLWDLASGRHTEDSASFRKAAPWLFGPASGINSACWLNEETVAVGNICGASVWDRRSRTVLRTVHGYPALYRGCCFSPSARLAAFPAQGLIRLRSLDDGRLLYTLLWFRDDLTGVVGPEGHWRGTPGLEKELVYVVQTEHGQETLAPEAFAKKYGWKNDPSKATPKAGEKKQGQ
jgi:WD40 repeat protein